MNLKDRDINGGMMTHLEALLPLIKKSSILIQSIGKPIGASLIVKTVTSIYQIHAQEKHRMVVEFILHFMAALEMQVGLQTITMTSQ